MARAARGDGYTLLEMLAVVLMFAVLAAFVMPNLGIVQSRSLRRHAEDIASQLELARQRAIATGIRHRVVFDLEEHSYRVEWQEPPEEDEEEAPALPASTLGAAGPGGLPSPAGGAIPSAPRGPLDLRPPQSEEHEFVALPGPLGKEVFLDEEVGFAGIETPGGWVETGEASVAFEADGTTEYTTVRIDDAEGKAVTLEILPLADVIRILDEG